MPTISVIIPVYNAEKYIEGCISSIINQSFPDFELILVDDGSTDLSGTLCDSFVTKDNRIKVFHRPNGGVSSARNYGIEKSSGEWIVFVDSDDYVDWNYLKILYEYSIDCDIVSCGYVVIDEYGNVKRKHPIINGFFSQNDTVDFINNYCCNTSSWSHLIRSNIIKDNGILFCENRSVGEDTVFILNCFVKANCYKNISSELYYYRITQNSLMHPDEKQKNKFINDFLWSNNQVITMNEGTFYFYYLIKCYDLMLFLYKNDIRSLKHIFKELHITISYKKRLKYWKRLSIKRKFFMSYIFFHNSIQYIILILLLKIHDIKSIIN